MANFVLVHGAWHGGWCWVRVANLLVQQGHRVLTPTLTGLGDRAHLLSHEVNLDTHIQDVMNSIEAEEVSAVTLCGHSYGGVVITGAADRITDHISSIVYLDAFIPENGQAQRDLIPVERQADADALVKEQGDGWKVPPRSAESFMVQNAEDRDWVNRRCVPHPYATMTQQINLTGNWKKIPGKTYIMAGLYTTSPFGPFADAAENDPDWHYEEIKAGHDVMLDAPAELADALIRAAAL
ncbi:MAG: alpha/beta fold hydrolase [Alphaproteobacteria bacterium]|nr:alpha/beta fold hydrolase [Alphaproteobacteria bacterium]